MNWWTCDVPPLTDIGETAAATTAGATTFTLSPEMMSMHALGPQVRR